MVEHEVRRSGNIAFVFRMREYTATTDIKRLFDIEIKLNGVVVHVISSRSLKVASPGCTITTVTCSEIDLPRVYKGDKIAASIGVYVSVFETSTEVIEYPNFESIDDEIWLRDHKKTWDHGGGSDAIVIDEQGIYSHDYLENFNGNGGAGGGIGEDGENIEIVSSTGTTKLGQKYTLPAFMIKGGKAGHAVRSSSRTSINIAVEGDMKGKIQSDL
jgi:hypothetical protein